MAKDRIKLAFIGAGARMAAYAENFHKKTDITVDYVAVCDNSEDKIKLFKEIYGNSNTCTYTDYRKMLNHHSDVDGIIITTPNYTHEEIAIECFKVCKNILLEKPVSITPKLCLSILRAAKSYSAKVTLGYVLRYAPFYQSLQIALENHSFGVAQTITAEELVDKDTTRMFAVGWRNNSSLSGGLMIEKCCHDMDIFYYLLKKRPQSVFSTGNNLCFARRSNVGPKCSVCSEALQCPYFVDVSRRKIEFGYQKFENFNEDCVYLSGMDICDHQTVVMKYEDGLILIFTVALGADYPTRTFRLIGSKGGIYGDFAQGKIMLGDLKQSAHTKQEITTDGSGHGGGDGVCAESFINQICDENYKPQATLEDGFHSCVLAYAADKSMHENKTINISDIYSQLGLKVWTVEPE